VTKANPAPPPPTRPSLCLRTLDSPPHRRPWAPKKTTSSPLQKKMKRRRSPKVATNA
jgi:hypothetical protein